MTDDGGVLENLPRSRPGRRSEKRTKPASAARPKARPATRRPAKRARETRKPTERPAPPSAERSHPDPVGGVIRGAAKAAGTGIRVSRAVAQEVLRRLPRP